MLVVILTISEKQSSNNFEHITQLKDTHVNPFYLQRR